MLAPKGKHGVAGSAAQGAVRHVGIFRLELGVDGYQSRDLAAIYAVTTGYHYFDYHHVTATNRCSGTLNNKNQWRIYPCGEEATATQRCTTTTVHPTISLAPG